PRNVPWVAIGSLADDSDSKGKNEFKRRRGTDRGRRTNEFIIARVPDGRVSPRFALHRKRRKRKGTHSPRPHSFIDGQPADLHGKSFYGTSAKDKFIDG